MKLTQTQRADLLAQFMAARASASRITSEVVADAKEILEAYEAELATWPELPPAAYGPATMTLDNIFRSDGPAPLTEEQVKSLGKLPDLMSPIRNPEGIDFSKYPIPTGYTVASEEDCKEAGGFTPAGWCQLRGLRWYKFKTNYTKLHDYWTYIRPLRDNER